MDDRFPKFIVAFEKTDNPEIANCLHEIAVAYMKYGDCEKFEQLLETVDEKLFVLIGEKVFWNQVMAYVERERAT